MNTVEKGDVLELAIFDLLNSVRGLDQLPIRRECCKVYHRKGYYSKDRGSKIIFDVSVEVFIPGAETFFLLLLFECKNYNKLVPVDKVEEFNQKVEQVAAANSKAVFVTTKGFQRGAVKFATSKGIGLARYFGSQELKWDLYRPASTSYLAKAKPTSVDVDAALTQDEFRSFLFDLYMLHGSLGTVSLSDFVESLVAASNMPRNSLRKIKNNRSRNGATVPFLEKSRLETIADEALTAVGYKNGAVKLEQLAKDHPATKDFAILRTSRPLTDEANPPLGLVSFVDRRIELFVAEEVNAARERFTLAHELAHILLDHGRYMRREFTDAADHEKRIARGDIALDVPRMEFQANNLASYLLLPRYNFIDDFKYELGRLDVRDKGHGLLYVDSQTCNIDNYIGITDRLMKRYGASRAAVAIRLTDLGLLRDVRSGRSAPETFGISLLNGLEALWQSQDTATEVVAH